MPDSSRTSAGATYLDREGRIEQLRRAASRAAGRMDVLHRVILFGSLARGTPTPRSDADILVIVESTTHAQQRDRIPEVLPALSPLPCPVNLFVLTMEETARLRAEGSSFYEMIQATGIDLLPKAA